jgi:hypothetical protein
LRFPKDRPHTEEFVDLLKGILTKDPAKRFDLNMIKNQKWMLLPEGAIELKVELAIENYERDQQKRRE